MSTAIAAYTQLKEMARSENVQERFMHLLGSSEKGLSFLASTLAVVSESDKLMKCDPVTILSSAAQAATYDLVPNPATGFAWLIPYKGKCTFQIGYKGYIQLAMRTGRYEKIHAGPIYEGEKVIEDRLTGDISLEGNKTSDEVIGYVAYFRLKDGFEKFAYMSVDEIHAHAKKFSKSYDHVSMPWKTSFEAMAKKTVLKGLLSKYGPMSISLTDAMSADQNGHEEEPAFDIDAQFSEVKGDGDNSDPESETETTTGKRYWSETIINSLVDANIVQHSKHAVNSLNLSNLDSTSATIAEAKAWIKAHQAWKDDGKTTIEAAELANVGEVPT